jgi:CheY-like chemotaxis protein
MVYGMVRRHRGNLEIESAPDAGTTVRLTLPRMAHAADKPAAAPVEPTGKPEEQGRLRVLIVDDDSNVVRILRSVLEGDGHLVTEATGGEEAIEIIRAASGRDGGFQVVITDLGMPVVDGWRVAEAVKQASPETRVLLLTGWEQQLAVAGRKSPYVDRVLGKPVTLHHLRQALARGDGVKTE